MTGWEVAVATVEDMPEIEGKYDTYEIVLDLKRTFFIGLSIIK